MAGEITPYENARKLIPVANMPSWLNEYDRLRYAAYGLYEDIYWMEPGSFKNLQRGTEENPLQMPVGRIIVNTMARYTGRDMVVAPDTALGVGTDQDNMAAAFTVLFKRERFKSVHNTQKLYGIMRGDAFWHIMGNPLKPQGSRLSIRPLDPRTVFPINPVDDVDRVIGYDIVEQTEFGDTTYISRTRYLKPEHPGHQLNKSPNAPFQVQMQKDLLEVENWETEPKVFRTEQPPVLLPPQITALPIYHVKNMEEPGNPFGRSEMSGLERPMAGINQSMTDEEITLAMIGIGMFKSDKGQPRDASGNPTSWILGPGRVVHDATFERVNGVQSVVPYLDHVKYITDQVHQVNGASDVARGVVDSTVAESGIALKLRLGPILDAAGDKNTLLEEVYNNMLFDLNGWFSAYEGLNFGDARMVVTFKNDLPKNVDAEFNRLLTMVSADPPLITMSYFREACNEMGIVIPKEVNGIAIAEELQQFRELAGDPEAARLDEEIANEDGGTAETPPEGDEV